MGLLKIAPPGGEAISDGTDRFANKFTVVVVVVVGVG